MRAMEIKNVLYARAQLKQLTSFFLMCVLARGKSIYDNFSIQDEKRLVNK
jgi:hypothetical protein